MAASRDHQDREDIIDFILAWDEKRDQQDRNLLTSLRDFASINARPFDSFNYERKLTDEERAQLSEEERAADPEHRRTKTIVQRVPREMGEESAQAFLQMWNAQVNDLFNLVSTIPFPIPASELNTILIEIKKTLYMFTNKVSDIILEGLQPYINREIKQHDADELCNRACFGYAFNITVDVQQKISQLFNETDPSKARKINILQGMVLKDFHNSLSDPRQSLHRDLSEMFSDKGNLNRINVYLTVFGDAAFSPYLEGIETIVNRKRFMVGEVDLISKELTAFAEKTANHEFKERIMLLNKKLNQYKESSLSNEALLKHVDKPDELIHLLKHRSERRANKISTKSLIMALLSYILRTSDLQYIKPLMKYTDKLDTQSKNGVLSQLQDAFQMIEDKNLRKLLRLPGVSSDNLETMKPASASKKPPTSRFFRRAQPSSSNAAPAKPQSLPLLETGNTGATHKSVKIALRTDLVDSSQETDESSVDLSSIDTPTKLPRSPRLPKEEGFDGSRTPRLTAVGRKTNSFYLSRREVSKDGDSMPSSEASVIKHEDESNTPESPSSSSSTQHQKPASKK